jgi:uncharacterized glyoxalase superfamily protein PhnB
MWQRTLVATLPVLFALASPCYAADANAAEPATAHAPAFTGEILPVFYVSDVLRSVAFYTQKLGFVCDHFFDQETGGSVKTWTKSVKPIYAEMRSGEHKFALHLTPKPDSFHLGGMIHYFGVKDVRAHFNWVKSQGVEVGELKERPWMNMFSVTDPDGHMLYFFTRPEDQNTDAPGN